jgi:hypothetical protein
MRGFAVVTNCVCVSLRSIEIDTLRMPLRSIQALDRYFDDYLHRRKPHVTPSFPLHATFTLDQLSAGAHPVHEHGDAQFPLARQREHLTPLARNAASYQRTDG